MSSAEEQTNGADEIIKLSMDNRVMRGVVEKAIRLIRIGNPEHARELLEDCLDA